MFAFSEALVWDVTEILQSIRERLGTDAISARQGTIVKVKATRTLE